MPAGRCLLREYFNLQHYKTTPRLGQGEKTRNPATGAEVMVPEGRRVRFKIGKRMEERISSGAAPAG